MSLSDLASIGSLASGLAVLASLIYLTMQIRQSDKHQRALMSQGTITRNIDILTLLSQSRFFELISRVAAGETNFNAEEIGYLQLRLRVTLLSTQDTYIQHEAGLIDEINFENSLTVLRNILSQPVYRAVWKISRNGYAPDFANFIEKQIATIPLTEPGDPVAKFKEALATVTG